MGAELPKIGLINAQIPLVNVWIKLCSKIKREIDLWTNQAADMKHN